MNRRFLYSDNGTITEITPEVGEFDSLSYTFTQITYNQDYIYIGSKAPFNHVYVKMGTTVNVLASIMSVDYWTGSAFEAAVDVLDETKVSGATLAKSGFISWTPNKTKSWTIRDTEYIDELDSVNIYDMYWIRLKLSANPTASIKIAWIGNLFSNDNDLAGEFSSLCKSSLWTAWTAGKTSWEEQHIIAANLIVNDLIAVKRIWDVGQILTKEDLKLASVQKVAEIIFSSPIMGDDYSDQKSAARKEYEIRLNKSFPVIDERNSAIIGQNAGSTVRFMQGKLSR